MKCQQTYQGKRSGGECKEDQSLPPRSGSSLEAVEPHPQKGAIKFLKFFQKSKEVFSVK